MYHGRGYRDYNDGELTYKNSTIHEESSRLEDQSSVNRDGDNFTVRNSIAFPKDTENTVGQFESPRNSEKREVEMISNDKINI